MIILGIDPGTARTGWGVVKTTPKLAFVAYGTIDTEKTKAPEERLLAVEQELERLVKKYKPRLVAVERLYFFKNVKTALPVSEARGVALLVAGRHGLKVQEFPPQQVKMAVTGYGKAQKKQVQRMVQQILGLASLPKPDDAADALGIAITASLLTRAKK